MFNLLLTLFPSPETATTAFVSKPPNPSYAVEGEDFTLKWTYILDGRLMAAQFSNVTEGGIDPIGQRNDTSKMNSSPKYEARFRGQATSSRAELKILGVKLSDEATYHLNLVSSHPTFLSGSVKLIVQCKY